MSFVLDTNAYSEFVKGNSLLYDFFNNASDIIVPVIVLAELRSGFVGGGKELQNEAALQRFTQSAKVSVIDITEDITHHFAQIFVEQKRIGKPIGLNDLWIAACARQLDLPILTLDKDFLSIASIKLVF
jgi:tRNA(fMet)-specific endonuclease VapC